MNYFILSGLFLFAPAFCTEELAETVPTPEINEEIAFNPFLASKEKKSPPEEENGYTINYNTVSIIEYIRFASKICNTNFIFDDQDLNFTVTVVSKEPITPENVMATLLQILRIHELSILEQDGSLVIHKNDNVKQFAKIVTEGGKEGQASLVTRVFRLKNAKPESVSLIIKSMISRTAILEISAETRQLILTDIKANVDKVATLIDSLDSSHTTLAIRNFVPEFNTPAYLVEIAGQLMNPIAEGNPYHLVPANLTNSLYIVSTPELADRTIEILKTLDLPQKKRSAGERQLKAENIFVYKLEYRTGPEILSGLKGITENLEHSGIPDADLLETLGTIKWIRETNSMMIVGSEQSLNKVKEFIAALDVASREESQKTSFFIYKPVSRTAKEIYTAIEEMGTNLKETSGSDQGLVATLHSAKINATTNTITFSGEERTFPRVKELLATIDANGKQSKAKNSFYVYKLNIVTSSQFESSLKSFAKTLDKSNAADEGMVEAIEGMKYVKETNSYLFIGPEMALKRLQEVLPTFDGGASMAASSQFINYKPLHQPGPQLLSSLKDMTEHLKADHLADPMMLKSLESAKWVPSTGMILITGDPASLKKIQELIATLDGGANLMANNQFINYKPQHQKGPQLLTSLKDLTENLKADPFADLTMIRSLESAKWV
ncbi:MAG TPA: secretin N-terminal domain-containing protein, partial [Chlamydiales bacterium]|nr:secretin N-terminal domain-containing protein [Chlamydiales bacterium]